MTMDETWQEQAARKIFDDLCSRKGIGNEIEECDEDIQNEILCMMTDTIMEYQQGFEGK